MLRRELTLEATYVDKWGYKEGIRELLSNAWDAQTEYGTEVEIQHRPYNNTLYITTTGATIPREALLFGHSSKRERTDTIGQFGEGFKLGSLALVRDGKDVTIRTGSEVWRPLITHSETYRAEVLAFDITKGNKYLNRVAIEIGGITADMWDNLKKDFLRLCDIPEDQIVCVPAVGSIITDPAYKGRVYVKGIAVRGDANLQYGYNLLNARVDRDRKMVDAWDMRWYTKYMWQLAVNKAPKLISTFASLAANSTADLPFQPDEVAEHLNVDTAQQIAAAFRTQYGEDAFPVQTATETREVAFYGKKGIVVSPAYLALLRPEFGTTVQLQETFKYCTAKTYAPADLTDAENTALATAVQDVQRAIPGLSEASISIVDFKDSRTRGLYHGDSGQIELARSLLTDPAKLLVVLVHEATHMVGGDGTKDHEDAQCNVWANMFLSLKSASAA
jgi:hypothetical protein